MTLPLLNVFGFEVSVFLSDFMWKNNTFSILTSISFFQLFDEKLQNCKDDEQRKASTFCLKNCLSGGVVHQFAVAKMLSTHLLGCQNHFKQLE